jgi:nucleoid DNA-binding protein
MTESTNSAKAMNKTEITAALAEASGIDKKQVATLLEELGKLIGRNLADGGPGVFTVPGLLKISVSRKPATPERKGINPFTKEEVTFKAKPARNAVKVQALKGLKEMV